MPTYLDDIKYNDNTDDVMPCHSVYKHMNACPFCRQFYAAYPSTAAAAAGAAATPAAQVPTTPSSAWLIAAFLALCIGIFIYQKMLK